MSAHLPDAWLTRFVEGELDESDAVRVAEHLDACPRCAARAACLEPLQAVFAQAVDPSPPAGLREAVLAELERQPTTGAQTRTSTASSGERVAGPLVASPSARRPVDRRDRPPRAEIAIGGGLLTAAAALLATLGDPIALASQSALVAYAAGSLGRALLHGLPSPVLMVPLTVLVGASGTAVLVRSAWPDARASREAA